MSAAISLRLYAADEEDSASSEESSSEGKPSADWTLSEFYARWFTPVVLRGRPRPPDAATLAGYGEALRWWARLTGEPSLRSIDDATVARFTSGLAEAPGRRGDRLAAGTRRKHALRIGAVLAATGPRRERRPGARLIDPPAVPLPDPEPHEPEAPTLDELRQLYAAAERMTRPKLLIPPVHWWRALLVVGYTTGLRINTLLELRWSWIDFETSEIRVPKESMKGRRRAHTARLSVEAQAHLAKINLGYPRCFPWPVHRRRLDDAWDRLVTLAGLDPKSSRLSGFHALRRSHATEMAAENPLAASLSLGHRSNSHGQNLLADCYADRRLIDSTLAKLPSFVPAEPLERQLSLF